MAGQRTGYQRCRQRARHRAVRRAVARPAHQDMGAVGCRVHRHLAVLRAADLLEPERRAVQQQPAHRLGRDRVVGAGPHDAGHEHGGHDGPQEHPAWLDLFAIDGRAAAADRRHGADWASDLAYPDGLPVRPHRYCVGAVLCWIAGRPA